MSLPAMGDRPMRTWIGSTIILAGVTAACVVACRVNVNDLFTGEDFLTTGSTRSFFTAIQVDPRSEDSAGPAFVVAADLDDDGMTDLVSAWKQTQPVQLHLQRRSATGAITFETTTLADNLPAVSVAGLSVADFDADGRPDIAVLTKKAPLLTTGCLDGQAAEGLAGAIAIYIAPTDPAQVKQALAWRQIPVGTSFLSGSGDGTGAPEHDGFTSMAVGDMDQDGDMDVVVAWNTTCAGGNRILLFTNLGPGQVRDGTWSVTPLPDSFADNVAVKDVALADVDRDGDLDVIATRPESEALRIHWFRNPTIDVEDDFHVSDGQWQVGVVGQIDTGADIIRLGDIDRDGIVDVVVRSTSGRVIQWLKGPIGPTSASVGNVAWQVFTLAELSDRTPEAIALGDLNADGQLEVVAAAGGGLVWFDAQRAPSVFDQWTEVTIVDPDQPVLTTADPPQPADPTTAQTVAQQELVGGTSINAVLIVDLDGDGANDFVATLDRSAQSGLSNDALVWFRNSGT